MAAQCIAVGSCFAGLVARCMRSCKYSCYRKIHSVYSTARNGLWEDPVEATTGVIFGAFEHVSVSAGLGKPTASYLTWRYCYLQCGAFFGMLYMLTSSQDFQPRGGIYEQLIQQFPVGLRRERFESLLAAFSWWNPITLYVWAASFALLLLAIFMSTPSRAISRRRLSRRLIWGAWLMNFVFPFVALLVFPIRSLVDWTGIESDVCTMSVMLSARAKGVNLEESILALQHLGLLKKGADTFAPGMNMSDESSVRAWCESEGTKWHETFHGNSVPCALATDRQCRSTVCATVLDNSTKLGECVTHCLAFAQNDTEESAAFMSSLSACNSSTINPSIDSSVDVRSVDSLVSVASMYSQSSPIDLQCSGTMQLFDELVVNQQLAIDSNARSAATFVQSIDYVVGLFVAVRAGVELLPSALSILGGLAEALINTKAVFPGSQGASWILILTTLEAIPIYSAFFAILQQLIGDAIFAISAICFVGYICLSCLTAARSLNLRESDSERQMLYRKVWCEYGLRVVLGAGGVGAALGFIQREFGFVQIMLVDATPFIFFTLLLIDYYARKSLLAVAATDALLSAFLQSELWRSSLPSDSKSTHEATLKDLSGLLVPTQQEKVTDFVS
eukprot:TRINITY_DN25506_c0_g1_i1.p1 TRINITY_DN25506_c0_g1~~TRINITY_DN25506_c0_g1_i1.p1  ORF type:complete len:619 (+),score=42.60 TRINITY_DN25506_c0_g1_i1:81-1937(+)